jgi:hypothetical protein
VFLDEDELYELTGRKRHDAQARELRHMGIEFKIRRNGSLVVLSEHAKTELGGNIVAESNPERLEPNWDAI